MARNAGGSTRGTHDAKRSSGSTKKSTRRPTPGARTPRRNARESEDATPAEAASEAGDKLYYRIGEVAKITGVKAYVLRYWESEFRWMAPQKSRSKQRLYRRKDIDTILLIKRLLYEERYTIAGARKFLREMGVGRALEAAEEKLDHRAEYRAIRAELEAIRALL